MGSSSSRSAEQAISLEFDQKLRIEGEHVEGVVELDPSIALENDIVEVHVALKVRLDAWFRDGKDRIEHCFCDLITDNRVLWTQKQGGGPTLRLPFKFTLDGAGHALLPSFDSGLRRDGGKVQYFIRVVGVREPKTWTRFDIIIDSAFSFLPFDHSAAATTDFTAWTAPWTVSEVSFRLRSNPLQLFSPPALVHVKCRVPETDTLPLSRPIPVFVDVTCTSRPLDLSCADDPTTFLFPRLPRASEVSLELVGVTKADARGGWKCKITAVLQKFPVALLPAAAPTWLQDNDNPKKGRWSESSSYSATLTLRCSPVFQTELITYKVFLKLKLTFPGLGNDVKATIGPFNVTSGIVPGSSGHTETYLDLPPYYWDVVDIDKKDKQVVEGSEKK